MYWGNNRSIIAGGLVMAIGEFFLFFCGNFYDNAAIATPLFYIGLGCMIAGNGFFKPNISSMVGQLYKKGDSKIDAAYTIFYMGINTGGALGPIVCGYFGDTGSKGDFKWAFLAGGIAMLLSVITQMTFQKKYLVDTEGAPIGQAPANAPKFFQKLPVMVGFLFLISLLTVALVYIDIKVVSYLFWLLLACILFIAFIIFSDSTLNLIEKKKVAVLFTVSFFVIFFWSAFEQAGASLTFFAEEQTDRKLTWFALSPDYSWLVTYSKFVYNYLWLAPTIMLLRLIVLNFLPKYRKGAIITIVVYLILMLVSFMLSRNSFEVPTSFFQSLNSIFVVTLAPLVAWIWIKLGKLNKEPSSPFKMAMGLMLLALGYLWIATGVNGVGTGIKVSMIWIVGMYMMHTFGELCLSPIGLSLFNKLAPFKFASLLMAVWFTANAFANKLAGVFSALYPENGKTTSFVGYQITNLHEFFMFFVFMAGLASIILFFLSRKLKGLMES
jgi:POT family proton-dependent oligopeptide transporter